MRHGPLGHGEDARLGDHRSLRGGVDRGQDEGVEALSRLHPRRRQSLRLPGTVQEHADLAGLQRGGPVVLVEVGRGHPALLHEVLPDLHGLVRLRIGVPGPARDQVGVEDRIDLADELLEPLVRGPVAALGGDERGDAGLLEHLRVVQQLVPGVRRPQSVLVEQPRVVEQHVVRLVERHAVHGAPVGHRVAQGRGHPALALVRVPHPGQVAEASGTGELLEVVARLPLDQVRRLGRLQGDLRDLGVGGGVGVGQRAERVAGERLELAPGRHVSRVPGGVVIGQ